MLKINDSSKGNSLIVALGCCIGTFFPRVYWDVDELGYFWGFVNEVIPIFPGFLLAGFIAGRVFLPGTDSLKWVISTFAVGLILSAGIRALLEFVFEGLFIFSFAVSRIVDPGLVQAGLVGCILVGLKLFTRKSPKSK
jgi:hypothetical protein